MYTKIRIVDLCECYYLRSSIVKKKFKSFFYFPFLVGLLLISSCRKENMWDMFKGTGKNISEIRALPAFAKIYLKDNVNVIITQGSTQEVKVEAGEKLVPLIRTRVDTGTLFISNDNSELFAMCSNCSR